MCFLLWRRMRCAAFHQQNSYPSSMFWSECSFLGALPFLHVLWVHTYGSTKELDEEAVGSRGILSSLSRGLAALLVDTWIVFAFSRRSFFFRGCSWTLHPTHPCRILSSIKHFHEISPVFELLARCSYLSTSHYQLHTTTLSRSSLSSHGNRVPTPTGGGGGLPYPGMYYFVLCSKFRIFLFWTPPCVCTIFPSCRLVMRSLLVVSNEYECIRHALFNSVLFPGKRGWSRRMLLLYQKKNRIICGKREGIFCKERPLSDLT